MDQWWEIFHNRLNYTKQQNYFGEFSKTLNQMGWEQNLCVLETYWWGLNILFRISLRFLNKLTLQTHWINQPIYPEIKIGLPMIESAPIWNSYMQGLIWSSNLRTSFVTLQTKELAPWEIQCKDNCESFVIKYGDSGQNCSVSWESYSPVLML